MYIHINTWGFPGGSVAKHPPAMQEMQDTQVWFLGWKDPLGGGHGNPLKYSCLEIPWTEEPSGLQSTGSQRVRHDWATGFRVVKCLVFHLQENATEPTHCKNWSVKGNTFSMYPVLWQWTSHTADEVKLLSVLFVLVSVLDCNYANR